ncbi:MAG: YHYH protein, partial [Actinomycetota bacterium]
MSAYRLLAVAGLAAAAAACGSGETTFESASVEVIDEAVTASETADRLDPPDLTCDEQAALFAAGPSVNPDLADPESSAVCVGDSIVITANGIPDYTYIETSPGSPRAADLEFTIPADPEVAATTTAVPALGTAAVSLTGIPIYGPTEGTGGDVLSLVGGLSECGSHNGPTGFHIHLFGTSATTDCLFTPEQAAAAPQLLGYALDGYPIYTGNDQYTSSWELTDPSLFATDTWAAHSYVEGLGDLDECNGRFDANGNYAYYTTDTVPYVLGCYTGVVDLDGAGGGGGGGGQGPGSGGPGG